MFSFFTFKCILGICLVLWCLFLHDFATVCPIRPVMGLNVAVRHGRVRLGLGPGFRVRVSRVRRFGVRVSIRVRDRF